MCRVAAPRGNHLGGRVGEQLGLKKSRDLAELSNPKIHSINVSRAHIERYSWGWQGLVCLGNLIMRVFYTASLSRSIFVSLLVESGGQFWWARTPSVFSQQPQDPHSWTTVAQFCPRRRLTTLCACNRRIEIFIHVSYDVLENLK